MQRPAGPTEGFRVRLTQSQGQTPGFNTAGDRNESHQAALLSLQGKTQTPPQEIGAARSHVWAQQDHQELLFTTGGSEHPQWLPPTGRPCQQAQNTKEKPKSIWGKQPAPQLPAPSLSLQAGTPLRPSRPQAPHLQGSLHEQRQNIELPL